MTPRFIVQAISSILSNSYLKGFVSGKIYDGSLKHICIPVLNCYSCPGALFSCPVGAVQHILSSGGISENPISNAPLTASNSFREKFWNILTGTPWFVLGMMMAVGALFGRATCGWLCPFGFLQDILYRMPVPKVQPPKFLRLAKYLFLIVMVILMPLFWVDNSGFSEPTYCKYICPAGTLQGGLFLPALNPDLRALLGKLFAWKLALLVIFILAMLFIRRPFCSWACPIGAFLGLFNRVSLLRLSLKEHDRCVKCGACRRVCVAGLDPIAEIDSPDCVRCMECVNACHLKLIEINTPFKHNAADSGQSNLNTTIGSSNMNGNKLDNA